MTIHSSTGIWTFTDLRREYLAVHVYFEASNGVTWMLGNLLPFLEINLRPKYECEVIKLYLKRLNGPSATIVEQNRDPYYNYTILSNISLSD